MLPRIELGTYAHTRTHVHVLLNADVPTSISLNIGSSISSPFGLLRSPHSWKLSTRIRSFGPR